MKVKNEAHRILNDKLRVISRIASSYVNGEHETNDAFLDIMVHLVTYEEARLAYIEITEEELNSPATYPFTLGPVERTIVTDEEE